MQNIVKVSTFFLFSRLCLKACLKEVSRRLGSQFFLSNMSLAINHSAFHLYRDDYNIMAAKDLSNAQIDFYTFLLCCKHICLKFYYGRGKTVYFTCSESIDLLLTDYVLDSITSIRDIGVEFCSNLSWNHKISLKLAK